MKGLFFMFIFCLTLGLSNSYARTSEIISQNEEMTLQRITVGDRAWYNVITNENSTATYQIVKVSSVAIILEGTSKVDGRRFWNTVSSILTRMLPETARGICLATIRKPKLCNAIYEASVALVNMRAGYYDKGDEEDVVWRADKGSSNCSATIATNSFADAADAATVFEEYENRGCMKYHTPTTTEYYTNDSPAPHYQNENCTCPKY